MEMVSWIIIVSFKLKNKIGSWSAEPNLTKEQKQQDLTEKRSKSYQIGAA